MKKHQRKLIILLFVVIFAITLESLHFYRAKDVVIDKNIEETLTHIVVNKEKAKTIVIFPEKNVESKAYIPFAQLLSQQLDAKIYIMRYLFHKPNFYINLNTFAEDAMAIVHGEGSYAVQNVSFNTMVYLASVPPKKIENKANILAIQSELDHVLEKDAYFAKTSNFNINTTFQILEGANHSFYGNYGLMKNDIPGLFTPEKQQQAVIKQIKIWLEN